MGPAMGQERTRRQHYLPCFVQNGHANYVALNGHRRRYRVHVFRRGEPPKEVYTRKVGFEDDFYSRAGEPDIEAKLARDEGERFLELVRGLRFGVIRADLATNIPAFVAHLL